MPSIAFLARLSRDRFDREIGTVFVRGEPQDAVGVLGLRGQKADDVGFIEEIGQLRGVPEAPLLEERPQHRRGHLRLPAARGQDVEVIRGNTGAAQEPEHADRPEAAGPLDTERAEAHHPSARVANHEKVKLQPLAEMEPPRVEPFPGEKYRRTGALIHEAVPVHAQGLEGVGMPPAEFASFVAKEAAFINQLAPKIKATK